MHLILIATKSPQEPERNARRRIELPDSPDNLSDISDTEIRAGLIARRLLGHSQQMKMKQCQTTIFIVWKLKQNQQTVE